MKIELLKEVASTNDYIKKYLSGGENAVVCAERQTQGRGTKGRSFLSNEGGVYLSALTFYDALPAAEAFTVMSRAAVAVCRTAERFGLSPAVKWPNDVLVRGKKLAGILIENGIAEGAVRYSIVGVGLNVNNELAPLGHIATSLLLETGTRFSVPAVRDALIGELFLESGFEDYLRRVRFLGEEVYVTGDGAPYTAIARRILPNGCLEVSCGGGLRVLSCAEVSIGLGENS